jgi:hypothetical protein
VQSLEQYWDEVFALGRPAGPDDALAVIIKSVFFHGAKAALGLLRQSPPGARGIEFRWLEAECEQALTDNRNYALKHFAYGDLFAALVQAEMECERMTVPRARLPQS